MEVKIEKERDLLKEVVIEIANILLDQYGNAVEQKIRKKVDKLKLLVNPLK